jgi:hypothetical protein
MVGWYEGQSTYPQHLRKVEWERLTQYVYEASKPERHFHDPDLERKHTALVKALDAYLGVSATERVPNRTGDVYTISTKEHGARSYIQDYDVKYQRQVDAILKAVKVTWDAWSEYAKAAALFLA